MDAEWSGASITVAGPQLNVVGETDLGFAHPRLERVGLSLSDAWGAAVDATLEMSGGRFKTGRANVRGLDLARAWSTAVAIAPAIKSHYQPSGRVNATATFFTEQGVDKAVVELTADKLAVVSSRVDLPSGVEDLRLRNTTSIAFTDNFGRAEFDSVTRLSDAIVYHDRLFADFAGRTTAIEAAGCMDLRGGRITQTTARLRAGEALDASLNDVVMDFRRPSISARLAVAANDVGALFDGFVKQTFQESVPALKAASLRGRLALDTKVELDANAATMTGGVNLDHLSVRVGEAQVENMHGQVPLQLVRRFTPASAEVAAETAAGDLSRGGVTIQNVRVGSITASHLTIWPQIAANRFVLAPLDHGQARAALDTPLLGGRFSVAELNTSDLLREPFGITGRFSLRDADAAALLGAAGLPAYAGKINVPDCRLTFANGDLTMRGTITAAICDGEITVSDIKAYKLMQATPVFGADVEFHRLNLKQLTAALPGFGVISGELEGHARRILVQAGRPYSLDLDLRVVPRAGAPRWIDRNAVQSLIILSTGEAQPGIQSLLIFGGIRYSTFGLKCQINDDEVLIEGARKSGDRHIVFDSALTSIPQLTITVITGRPISYEDLLSRLKAAKENAQEKARTER
jgi:hypothetical protein